MVLWSFRGRTTDEIADGLPLSPRTNPNTRSTTCKTNDRTLETSGKGGGKGNEARWGNGINFNFLDESSHLYNGVCSSVRPEPFFSNPRKR